MKQRNPNWGSPKIAQQISLAFGVDINADVVRRVLSRYYRPNPHCHGPSWLTFLGHTKDSLWSLDMFRCESATLRTHWILLVMQQYTRSTIGFAAHAGIVDGVALCRMFNCAIVGQTVPKYLSSDHDPLYKSHRWRTNLRILDIIQTKSVPYVPRSHPFIERLIGTVRRECLDRVLFWHARDLERKLVDFKVYYNQYRTHDALDGLAPTMRAGLGETEIIDLHNYRWRLHCRGLYQTPMAA